MKPRLKPTGLVLANDGEVAVFLPLRRRGGVVKDYRRAQTMQRGEMAEKEFREEKYPIAEVAAEKKAEMLATLEVTEDEFQEAMRLARSDARESRNLMKLVRAYRESRQQVSK